LFDETTGRAIYRQQDYVTPPGTSLTVAGWGATSFGGGGSSVLLKANVATINATECALTFADLFALPDNVICATAAACDVSELEY
jgi:hypothetical protein